jgi:hypothetical protein
MDDRPEPEGASILFGRKISRLYSGRENFFFHQWTGIEPWGISLMALFVSLGVARSPNYRVMAGSRNAQHTMCLPSLSRRNHVSEISQVRLPAFREFVFQLILRGKMDFSQVHQLL